MKGKRWLAAFLILLVLLPGAALAEDKKLVITFIGDCTIGSEDSKRDYSFSLDSYAAKYGYDYFFKNVKSILSKDDLTVANFEGVLADSKSGKVRKTYNFRAPTKFVKVLTSSSIECVNISNNHTMDYGTTGIKSTVNTLKKAKVKWFGTNEVYQQTYVFTKDDIKVGFVGMEISYFDANKEVIQKQIQALKKKNCNIIVGVMHGGVEYASNRDKPQERTAHQLVDWGCHIVIGHHPHVPQGIEIYKNATICYSIGNFVFGGNKRVYVNNRTPKRRAFYSAMYRITFSFDDKNKYLGHQLNIIPVLVSSDENRYTNNYQPVLATGADAKKMLSFVQNDTPDFTLNPYKKGVGAVQDFVPAAKK